VLDPIANKNQVKSKQSKIKQFQWRTNVLIVVAAWTPVLSRCSADDENNAVYMNVNKK
jgi:hypothetical protein